MNQQAETLYQEMQEDIKICEGKEFGELEKIECCYQISTNYWQRIRTELKAYIFSDEAEEIYFFKKVKPLFLSTIEYYNLLYHAELFLPEFDASKQMKFWMRESERLEKFNKANKEFIQYYKEGFSYKDEQYFLRKNNPIPGDRSNSYAKISHDHLISDLLTLERYFKYVQSKLSILQ